MKKKKLKKKIEELQRSLDDATELFAQAAPVQWIKDQNQDEARAWSLLVIGWLGCVAHKLTTDKTENQNRFDGSCFRGRQVRNGQGVIGEVISDDGAKVVVRWASGAEGTFFSREALQHAGIELDN